MSALRAAHACASSNANVFAAACLILGVFFGLAGLAAVFLTARHTRQHDAAMEWPDNHPGGWVPPVGWPQ